MGQACSNGSCAVTCMGSTKCGNVCVDTTTDPANCGACGTACATGQTCVASQCM
jgi:hypothetical protein